MTVIHILVAGHALCGKRGVPNQWPKNHRWVSREDRHDATCPMCKSTLVIDLNQKDDFLLKCPGCENSKRLAAAARPYAEVVEHRCAQCNLRMQIVPVDNPKSTFFSCDFCSQHATWLFPCESFVAPIDDRSESIGDWAACEDCRPLVEGQQFDVIAKNANARMGKLVAMTVEELAFQYRHMMSTYQAFQEHRKGPPIRIWG